MATGAVLRSLAVPALAPAKARILVILVILLILVILVILVAAAAAVAAIARWRRRA